MSKFKVGDKVNCSDPTFLSDYLKPFETYIIEDVDQYNDVVKLKNVPFHWCESRFKLADSSTEEPEFDMKKEPWFIRVDNEEEFEIAKEFVKSKGFSFQFEDSYDGSENISNRGSNPEEKLADGIDKVIRGGSSTFGKKEIKLIYKKVLDKVEYPEVESPKSEQQLEIEKIEQEMRKLADRLNKLKGE